MAWSKAALSASDLAYAAADKPMILGRNWLRTNGITAKWTADGHDGSADIAATGYPAYGAYDEQDTGFTKPNAPATSQYFNINLGASAPGVIDAIAILNHNLVALSGVQIDVQIDDDPNFGTAHTIYTATPATVGNSILDIRTLVTVLEEGGDPSAMRFSGVRYLRIKFSKAGAFTPQFGELVLSRRRQLARKPNLDYDPLSLTSTLTRNRSGTGIITQYVFATNIRRIAVKIDPEESDLVADFIALYTTDLNGGTLPFIWIDDPHTYPTLGYWMVLDSPELIGPLVGPVRRGFAFTATEKGPNFVQDGT